RISREALRLGRRRTDLSIDRPQRGNAARECATLESVLTLATEERNKSGVGGASRMALSDNAGSVASSNTSGSAGGRLANRVALVTGASRGLGRSFAETLAREGAHVILANRSDVPEITEGIARAGGNANFVEMDVTRDDSILGAFEQIVTQWGPPSVVVNNAGITDVADTLKEDPAEFDRVISTNLRGPWMIAREAARLLVAAKSP